ncbi:hypothetical protein C9J03_17760 [Photobacterium gaetbulicola]|uniref:Uncharacterized protein n=1 Tax=Photobacterium gaetbulicola Gung47 TaxID=658445 RepID=A0A0C5WL07_9GAMM|nr:hypothetical protein [Photobacterium gaetbulicola]AJR06987.1 hypothetical protein H744_2c0234 [Photobacterium gaetbulicola Gung47]PSU05040.1 hypothetical protein C9J03_17760 [Photobacterium gaetbulicola]
MAKSLCKYRRVEIADQFSTISRMVSTANYMCSSCARVASEKGYLCKPSALKRPTDMAHVVKPSLTSVETATVSKLPKAASLPRGAVQAAALATELDTPALVVAAHPAVAASRKEAKKNAKQLKKLKKLAKKQKKQIKKAMKAIRRYQKVLEKAQASS